jgi:hypothetical protein
MWPAPNHFHMFIIIANLCINMIKEIDNTGPNSYKHVFFSVSTNSNGKRILMLSSSMCTHSVKR